MSICKPCAWAADMVSAGKFHFDELWRVGEGHPECKGGTHCDCQHGGRPLETWEPWVIPTCDGKGLTLRPPSRCSVCFMRCSTTKNGRIWRHKDHRGYPRTLPNGAKVSKWGPTCDGSGRLPLRETW